MAKGWNSSVVEYKNVESKFHSQRWKFHSWMCPEEICLCQAALYLLLYEKQLIPGFQTDIHPFKKIWKKKFHFMFDLQTWRLFVAEILFFFVLLALATISAKDLQEFEASQLSFCFSRGDCRKDSVSLLLAVEQVFSSGSSVESRNWWSCAGVDFLDYKTKKCSLVWKLSC